MTGCIGTGLRSVSSRIRKRGLEIYENWEGRNKVPVRVRELMMVIGTEIDKLYDLGGWEHIATMPKPSKLRDTKLG